MKAVELFISEHVLLTLLGCYLISALGMLTLTSLVLRDWVRCGRYRDEATMLMRSHMVGALHPADLIGEVTTQPTNGEVIGLRTMDLFPVLNSVILIASLVILTLLVIRHVGIIVFFNGDERWVKRWLSQTWRS